MLRDSCGVHISVREDPGRCPLCGGPWNVQKTVPRHGKTISHGQFEIRETVHVCSRECHYRSGALVTRRAKSLAESIIAGRTVGYDVLVFIGLRRYLHHCQREEIRFALLQEYGVVLSTGEISNLSRLFLTYMEQLHNKCSQRFQQIMAGDGGWPLHIDATGEDGRGTLLVVRAGWRKWVLGAWKVPTERADVILLCLRKVIQQFGAPCAIVRDLGRAVTPAVNELLSELELDIPVLACHQHFLSDIGTDLLKSAHGELRALFRRMKTRPKLGALIRELGRKLGSEIEIARNEARDWQGLPQSAHTIPNGRAGMATIRSLAQWTLDFSADSMGLDFPFDRPYLDFYARCVTAHQAVETYMRTCSSDKQVFKFLGRLERILDPIVSDVPFLQLVRRLRNRAKLFDELRDTLRLFPSSSSGSNKSKRQSREIQQLSAIELRDIQKQVEQLVISLKQRRPARGPTQDIRNSIDLILRHIKDHGDYLWGHVIQLPAEAGGGIRLVDRTNNILEGFFGNMKHHERRRSGRKILSQDFESLPSAAALVYNLNLPDYVAVLCGSLALLHKAFAQLDVEKRIEQLAGKQLENPEIPVIVSSSLPLVDRRIIRSDEMKNLMLAAAGSQKPHRKKLGRK